MLGKCHSAVEADNLHRSNRIRQLAAIKRYPGYDLVELAPCSCSNVSPRKHRGGILLSDFFGGRFGKHLEHNLA